MIDKRWSKEMRSKNISFWCHYSLCAIPLSILLFGKGFFYCQKSFSLKSFFKKGRSQLYRFLSPKGCTFMNTMPLLRVKSKPAQPLLSLRQRKTCIAFFPPVFSLNSHVLEPLLYCIKCQALKMEVEIREAAADLKAYKYRHSFAWQHWRLPRLPVPPPLRE